MKKLITLCACAIMAVATASAELYPSSRFVELGFDVGAGLNQNVLTAGDIFLTGSTDHPGQVVIDFAKIADDMVTYNQTGMVLDGNLSMDYFLNLDFKAFAAGLQTSVSSTGSFIIGRDLFVLLGKGNELDEEYKISMGMNFESYVSMAVPVSLRFGRLKVTAAPTAFVPLVYVPQPEAYISFVANSDGTLSVKSVMDFSAYGIFDLSALNGEVTSGRLDFTELLAAADTDTLLSDIAGSAGVDVSAAAEYELFSFLDVGAYVNVPVVPARLHNSMSGSVEFGMEMGSLLGATGSSSMSMDTTSPTFSGLAFSNQENYTVNRPFRVGAEAAFRPLGKWLTVRGRAGVAMRNPFGEDFVVTNSMATSSMYPEYRVGADVRLLYVFNIGLSHEYTDKVFINRLGLGFNFRVFELDLALATSSSDFAKSFQVGGLQFLLGVKAGF